MKPFFFHLALCLLLSLGGCKSLLEKGNEQFLSGQYQYAISTFNQILANDSSNLRARQVLADRGAGRDSRAGIRARAERA